MIVRGLLVWVCRNLLMITDMYILATVGEKGLPWLSLWFVEKLMMWIQSSCNWCWYTIVLLSNWEGVCIGPFQCGACLFEESMDIGCWHPVWLEWHYQVQRDFVALEIGMLSCEDNLHNIMIGLMVVRRMWSTNWAIGLSIELHRETDGQTGGTWVNFFGGVP